jgi:hypothetical protein
VKALPEIRDWISFALGFVGAYFAWRYRDRSVTGRTHHVLELHDTVTATDSIEDSAGETAILNDMAYTDPAFPQF